VADGELPDGVYEYVSPADIEIEGQTLLQKPFSPRDLITTVQQLLQ